MLRNSILYSVETCYNMTEHEIRALEKCEESFMRNIFKLNRNAPISMMYLEAGIILCRFEVMKKIWMRATYYPNTPHIGGVLIEMSTQ